MRIVHFLFVSYCILCFNIYNTAQNPQLVIDLAGAVQNTDSQWEIPISYLASTTVTTLNFTMNYNNILSIDTVKGTSQAVSDNFSYDYTNATNPNLLGFEAVSTTGTTSDDPMFLLVVNVNFGTDPPQQYQLGDVAAQINEIPTTEVLILNSDNCSLNSAFIFGNYNADLITSITLNPGVGPSNTIDNSSLTLGDGTTIDNPTIGTPINHTYASPGAYNVCYNIYDTANSCSDSYCAYSYAYICDYTTNPVRQYCDADSNRIAYEFTITGGKPSIAQGEKYTIALEHTNTNPEYLVQPSHYPLNPKAGDVVTVKIDADTPYNTEVIVQIMDDGNCIGYEYIIHDTNFWMLVGESGEGAIHYKQAPAAPEDRCCIADACTDTYFRADGDTLATQICKGNVLSCACEPLRHPDYAYTYLLTDVDNNIIDTDTLGQFSSQDLPANETYFIYAYSESTINPSSTSVSFATNISDLQGAGSGCFMVSSPCAFAVIDNSLNLSTINNAASCAVCPNGSAMAIPTDGESPYTFIWSNNSTAQELTAVPPATYSVTVSDNKGCEAVDTALITHNGANMQARVLLEGAYDSASQSMETNLLTNGLLPANQPFNVAPWHYAGWESVTVFPPNTTDWVLLELVNASDSIVARRAALLRNDGAILEVDGTPGVNSSQALTGEAHALIVRHRNHIAVKSTHNIHLPTSSPYDCTNFANILSGDTQMAFMLPNTYALRAGDSNADGVINIVDFNLFQSNLANVNLYHHSDFSLNGHITIGDFNVYKNNASHIGLSCIRY